MRSDVSTEHGSLFVFPPREPGQDTPTPGMVVHDYIALTLCTGGRVEMQQRERIVLGPGDVYLVPAGERHCRLAEDRAELWGLGFHAACYALTELAPLLEPFERVRAGACAVVHIPSARQEHLGRLFAELRGETSMSAARSELVQKSLLSLILAEIVRAASWSTMAGSRPSLVADALAFIERRCLEPISLRDVASAVARSPAHVTTALRLATGRSAVEWITAGRLAEARRRLLHTDELIEVIAERVGYADATHFARLFRRAHGMTPSAWRSKYRLG